MARLSRTSALVGRDRELSVGIGGTAVILGVLGFGAGWLSTVLGMRSLYGQAVFGLLGTAIVLAAVHAYENGGLLVSWLLLFCPPAGVIAFGASASPVGARGKRPLFGDIFLGWSWAVIAAVIGGTAVFTVVVLVRRVRTGEFRA